MKKLLLSFVFLLFFGSLFSTEWVQVTGQTNEASAIELVPSNSASSVLQFTLSGYYFKEVMTDRGVSMRILFDEGAPIMRAGAPDLPLMATSLVIPDRSQMEVVVLNAKFKEYQDVLITPSKGNLTRDIDQLFTNRVRLDCGGFIIIEEIILEESQKAAKWLSEKFVKL